MVDRAKACASSEASRLFTEHLTERLAEKNRLQLTKSREQFAVKVELVQHQEIPQTLPELAMSIHLEILDKRFDPPKVILQEVISYNTLLPHSLSENDFQNEHFRISPIGLAHAKLSREIATRIEDYVLLATKG